MQAVVGDVAVGVVGRRETADRGHAVCGSRVGRIEAIGAARLVDVAKGVVGEGLGRGASAVGAGNAREIIVGIVAGLRVGAVERVGDGQLIERAVGIPSEPANIGLRLSADIEFELGHAKGVGIVSESVGIAGTKVYLRGKTSRVISNGCLVQFGPHRGLQGSHIGGHIVYFYNVSAGERELAVANV